MSMEYEADEGEDVSPPLIFGEEHMLDCLSLRGWNQMLAPLPVFGGSAFEPAIAPKDYNRTGLYWVGDRLCYSREGIAQGEISCTEWTVVNNEAFTILAGQPVKPNGSTGILLAQATSAANRSWGVAKDTIASGEAGQIVLYGPVAKTDWASVTTPSVVTLTRGSRYFLAQGAAGLIAPTPPGGNGDVIQLQGTAMDAYTLLVGPFGRYLQL